jgi:hypothetical protein
MLAPANDFDLLCLQAGSSHAALARLAAQAHRYDKRCLAAVCTTVRTIFATFDFSPYPWHDSKEESQ